jgi:NAD(P)-dependent dehydrogenase (short-subunit alcohol dehydrogenase family)
VDSQSKVDILVDYNLDGKTAVITGASAGLGEQFAHALAGSGANVVLAARRKHLLEKVAEDIRSSHGVTAVPVVTDVRKEEDIINMVHCAGKVTGKLDILVNNAGMYIVKPLIEQTLDDWHAVMDVNLTSTFLASREAARLMIPQQSGCIINVTSTFGFGATSFPEVAYYTSKGGLVMLTKALAVELGKYNIRVNAIAPGFFPTDQSAEAFKSDDIRKGVIEPRTALPTFAENEWIRGTVCFLASEDARYITGHTIAVDGGWLAF